MFILRPVEKASRGDGVYRLIVSAVAVAVLAASWIAFALQKSPWTFYIYLAFPVYFWQQFLVHGAPDLISRVRKKDPLSVISWAIFVVASSQAMVVSYLPQHH